MFCLGLRWPMDQRPSPREMGVLTSESHAYIGRPRTSVSPRVASHRPGREERWQRASERDKTLPRRRPPRAAGDPARRARLRGRSTPTRPPRPGGDPGRRSRPRSRVGARCPPPPPPAQGFGGAGSRIAEVSGMHPGLPAPVPTCLVVTTWFDREFRVSS